MKIYTKTKAGLEVIKNPQATLPGRLRTLLICIDGRSPLQTYVKTLTAFGDVTALMESLEEAGLIEVVGQSSDLSYSQSQTRQPAGPPGLPTSDVSGLDPSFRIDAARVLTLRQAIGAMGDFVQMHLPDNAIEIVLMLDKVDSADALNELMPSYVELIRPFGEKAMQHLQLLAPITQNKFS